MVFFGRSPARKIERARALFARENWYEARRQYEEALDGRADLGPEHQAEAVERILACRRAMIALRLEEAETFRQAGDLESARDRCRTAVDIAGEDLARDDIEEMFRKINAPRRPLGPRGQIDDALETDLLPEPDRTVRPKPGPLDRHSSEEPEPEDEEIFGPDPENLLEIHLNTLDPGTASLYRRLGPVFCRGYLALAQGYGKRALQIFDDVSWETLRDPRPWLERAHALLLADRADEALDLLDKVVPELELSSDEVGEEDIASGASEPGTLETHPPDIAASGFAAGAPEVAASGFATERVSAPDSGATAVAAGAPDAGVTTGVAGAPDSGVPTAAAGAPDSDFAADAAGVSDSGAAADGGEGLAIDPAVDPGPDARRVESRRIYLRIEALRVLGRYEEALESARILAADLTNAAPPTVTLYAWTLLEAGQAEEAYDLLLARIEAGEEMDEFLIPAAAATAALGLAEEETRLLERLIERRIFLSTQTGTELDFPVEAGRRLLDLYVETDREAGAVRALALHLIDHDPERAEVYRQTLLNLEGG